MTQRVSRRYGFPFKGYKSSRPRHLCNPDDITQESSNMMFDPAEGAFFRRGGSFNLGGITGTTDSGWPANTVRARRMLAFSSPSDSTGQQTYGALWSEMQGAEVQEFGFYDWGNAANHVIGDSFGATHYPAHDHYLPLYPGQGNRLKTAADRRGALQGNANCIEAAGRILFPNYGATGFIPLPPISWNKRFNPSTGSGTEHDRVKLTGHLPPLPWMTITSPVPSVTAGNQPFALDNYFYLSVIFVAADGSPSMPAMPRPISPTLPYNATNYTYPGGVLLNRIGNFGDAGGSKYDYLDVNDIPIGPDGTVKRIVLATAQSSAANTLKLLNSDGTSALQIWFTLFDNTSTTFRAYDFNLTQDPNLVRLDHIMAPPAKFAWQGDQRVWVCNTLQNPAAVCIAPFQNNPDTTPGASVYEITLTTGPLTLNLIGPGGTDSIVLTGLTLQDMVDKVNLKLQAAATHRYAAALMPGANPAALCTDLVLWATYDYGDSGVGKMRAFSNAMPGILYVTKATNDLLTSVSQRRVFFTAGGPGQPSLAPDAWRALNTRDAPQHLGIALGGGHTFHGQVVICTKGIAIIRNIFNVKTGKDEDYRIESFNDRRGGISADSICQLDGAVGYLTSEGYIINDGLREILISQAIYNPASLIGEWQQEITASRLDVSQEQLSGTCPNTRFCVSAWNGRLFVAYRSSQQAQTWSDRLMVYDFSQGVAATGTPNFLNGDEPWGWSSPLIFDGNNYGVFAGPICFLPNEGYVMAGASKTTTAGRVDVIRMGDSNNAGGYDVNASLVASITTNGTNVATSFGSFGLVAQGATLTGHSKIPNGTSIFALSYNANNGQWTIVMSANATGSTTEATTVTGLKVFGTMYCAMDMVDSLKRKTAQTATVLYRGIDPISLLLSRDKSRNSQVSLTLPASNFGDPYARQVKNLPQVVKTPAEVLEFAVKDNGGVNDSPRVWGIEAEVDILDSVR